MSYLVTVTFGLKDEESSSYDSIHKTLYSLGLNKLLIGSSSKKHNLPANTYAGEFEGENASKIRDDLASQIQSKFEEIGAKATIYVTVGGNWSWGIRYT